MAEREPGFYWVKRKCELTPPAPEWEIAQYQSGGYWGFYFEMDSVTEDAIAEIGEPVERIWPEPQPITDAQKTGERFLVWVNAPEGRVDEFLHGWAIGSWEGGQWVIYMMGTTFMTTVRAHLVTRCYLLPPDVTP